MFGIRSQKIKIQRLAEECDRDRIECMIRAEPPVEHIRSIATAINTLKTLRRQLGPVIANGPQRPYWIIAATFGATLLIPCLLDRLSRTGTGNK